MSGVAEPSTHTAPSRRRIFHRRLARRDTAPQSGGVLLVGVVVLLVQHDQPNVGQRRKQGAARADDHVHQPQPGPAPSVVALALAQLAVPHRHPAREARRKAPHGLRGQRDLRHQHQRPLALRQRGRQGPQVNLGLARAGDAVQQHRLAESGWGPSAAAPARTGVAASSQTACWIGRQLGRVKGHELLAGQRVAPYFGLAQVHQAHLGQVFQVLQLAAGFGVDPARHPPAQNHWPGNRARPTAAPPWLAACDRCGRAASTWARLADRRAVCTCLACAVGGSSTLCRVSSPRFSSPSAAGRQRVRGSARSSCRPRSGPRACQRSNSACCRAAMISGSPG